MDSSSYLDIQYIRKRVIDIDLMLREHIIPSIKNLDETVKYQKKVISDLSSTIKYLSEVNEKFVEENKDLKNKVLIAYTG